VDGQDRPDLGRLIGWVPSWPRAEVERVTLAHVQQSCQGEGFPSSTSAAERSGQCLGLWASTGLDFNPLKASNLFLFKLLPFSSCEFSLLVECPCIATVFERKIQE
jgi:hypothetical protein